MSLYKQWLDLMEGQTDETFEAFWKEYSETETRVYAQIRSFSWDFWTAFRQA